MSTYLQLLFTSVDTLLHSQMHFINILKSSNYTRRKELTLVPGARVKIESSLPITVTQMVQAVC
jgi:hypothetical protein